MSDNGTAVIDRESLLDILAEMGGDAPTEEELGDNTLEQHALYERRQEREAGQVHAFRRVFKYRPWDGGVAFQKVLLRLFGTIGVGVTVQTMFGPEEPELREVPISLTETVQVPWGRIDFPIFGETAYFNNSMVYDDELGYLYELIFKAPKRFSAHIRGLFKEIEKELVAHSIYRGKAFDGREMPQFLDLSRVDPRRIIYSDEVAAALEADVWSLIEYTDVMRARGVPLKHTVLLEGEYGTGKTLAGYLTAQKAMDAKEDWTFIQCRPGRDEYEEVIATARLYQPCVVFFEDIDALAGEDDDLTRLLDIYDGAAAKGAEILVVLTTNHPERIHRGMIRPGRIDRVISVGKQDASSIRKLIDTTVDAELLADLDYDQIATAMEGFTPTFIKESIHRTMRHAIVRCKGQPTSFETADFVSAAESLHPHLKLMNDAGEGEQPEALEALFTEIVEDVLARAQGYSVHHSRDGAMFKLAVNDD